MGQQGHAAAPAVRHITSDWWQTQGDQARCRWPRTPPSLHITHRIDNLRHPASKERTTWTIRTEGSPGHKSTGCQNLRAHHCVINGDVPVVAVFNNSMLPNFLPTNADCLTINAVYLAPSSFIQIPHTYTHRCSRQSFVPPFPFAGASPPLVATATPTDLADTERRCVPESSKLYTRFHYQQRCVCSHFVIV